MDTRDFLFSSDCEMPALVWEYSGSITNIDSYSTKSVTIRHNLPFIPLLIGIWSTNPNFTPCLDISNYIGSGIGNDMQLNACGADATNVFVEGFNEASSSKNLYFKLLAFAPPDYTEETPNLLDSTNFMFNSDYNYPKIVKSGAISISASNSEAISHGLGYTPQSKVWGPDSSGRITPLYRMFAPSIIGTYGPTINNQSLTIAAQYTGKYYYHIYGDEA